MDKNKSRDWFRDHTDELKKIRPYLVLVGTGKQKLFPEQPVVITYFRKFPSIRLIPYANVALVGIPFTAVQRKKDLLATPHEIGHQVFWRWKELRGEIQNLSSVLPAYAERWAEEIFADTFGVQAVGAAAALYAQNLEAAFDRRHFQRDDGAHPTSVLRPYVHLKALNDENNPIVRELEELWTRYRESRTRRADHFEGHDGRPVEIDNAVGKGPVRQNYAHLKPTLPVDRLVELFLGKIPTGQVWSLQGSLDTLFSDFEAALGSLPFSQPLKEMDQAADITEINKLSDQSCSAIPLNDPTWYDVVRDYIEDDPAALLQTLPIPVNKWLPLMDMDAWADKGPTGNPRGD